MSMLCPECGAKHPDVLRFCEQDGAALVAESRPWRFVLVVCLAFVASLSGAWLGIRWHLSNCVILEVADVQKPRVRAHNTGFVADAGEATLLVALSNQSWAEVHLTRVAFEVQIDGTAVPGQMVVREAFPMALAPGSSTTLTLNSNTAGLRHLTKKQYRLTVQGRCRVQAWGVPFEVTQTAEAQVKIGGD